MPTLSLLTFPGSVMPHPDPWPVTQESKRRALAAMYAERIEAGICPICDPAQLLDDLTGACSNPYCYFAAFARPLAVSSPGDPRR